MNLFCVKIVKSKSLISPTAEESFRGMFRALLWLSLGLLLVLQLPWIADLLIQRTDFDVSLWCRVLQKLTLLCALVAFGIIMLCAYLGQNFIIQAFCRERDQRNSGWIWIPVIRNIHSLTALGKQNLLWGLLCVTQIVVTPVAWLIWLSSGPMNFYGMLLMSLGIVAGVWQMRLLTGATATKRQRICGFVLLCLFLVSLFVGYSMLYCLDFQLEAERLQWRSAGIPTTASEVKEFYFRGSAPDPKFTELCDRYAKRNYFDVYCASPSGYYTQPESERQKVREYLNSGQAELDFGGIERLIESKPFLKYQVKFKTPISETLIPYANYEREASRWFAARIIRAIEQKERIEAMRLFLLMTRFQETVLRNKCGVGALVAIACESIRCDTVSALLGSGILTDTDLEELKKYNINREKRLLLIVREGVRDGVYLDSEAQWGWNEFYSNFERAFTAKQRTEADNCFLFFCRVPFTSSPAGLGFLQGRGNMRSPLFLWTTVCSNQEFLDWMRLARRNVDYYNATDDYFQRSAERTALQNIAPNKFFIHPIDFNLAERYARTATRIRMTELALQVETFRRKNGHLPEKLDELGIPLPVDALSGEPIRYTKGKVKLWEWESGNNYKFRELPGWQLSAPGGNYQSSAQYQHESKRDTFTVITQWSVPAAPEPPKIEFPGFWSDAPKAEEAKP